jgi:CSLREA domain-containing protein
MKRTVLLIVALAALFMGLPAAGTATNTGPVKPVSGIAEGQTDQLVYVPLILAHPRGVFTVNTTDDAAGDGCTADHCSLRAAIDAANGHAGPDTIRFAIPASDLGCTPAGVCTLRPGSYWPPLTDDGTTIDGFTQPGAVEGTPPVLKIVLDGFETGIDGALTLRSAGNVVRGLVIGRFKLCCGIFILYPEASGNRVERNFIGTDPSGTLDWGNGTLPYSGAGSGSAMAPGTTSSARTT